MDTQRFSPDRSLVRLRPLSEDDVDDIMTWVNDEEITGHIAAFDGEPFTRDQELAFVRQTLASKTDRVWSFEEAATGRYAGQVGLHQIHWKSRVGRLGIMVAARDLMGRGLGSAALACAIDRAFGELSLHKVWLMVFQHNDRSRRTYARLGFQEEGVLREEYFHGSGWHHMVRMGLLDREWG